MTTRDEKIALERELTRRRQLKAWDLWLTRLSTSELEILQRDMRQRVEPSEAERQLSSDMLASVSALLP